MKMNIDIRTLNFEPTTFLVKWIPESVLTESVLTKSVLTESVSVSVTVSVFLFLFKIKGSDVDIIVKSLPSFSLLESFSFP